MITPALLAALSTSFYVLLLSANFSTIVPIATGASGFLRSERFVKIFWTFLCVDQLFSIGVFFRSWISVNNRILSHLSSPMTVGLLLWCFAEFQPNRRIRWVIYSAWILYVIAWTILTLTVEDTQHFSLYTIPLADALLILFSGMSLSMLYRKTTVILTTEPAFWFISGIFLYHLGAFIFQLFSGLLLSVSVDVYLTALGFKATLFILRNLLIAAGFLFLYKRHSSHSFA